MIFVYGDDSADEQRQRVASVAIVAGREENWKALEVQWVARNGTVPFHARDCESDQGDYRTIPHRQNKDLYKDLSIMLASSGLIGRTIAIDLIAQRDIFAQAPDIAYYKAFAELLEDVKELCIHFHESAKFKFDISTENEYNAGLLYAQFRENEPETIERFASEIAFGRAKECPRLQTADLIAYEGMKVLDNIIGPKKRPKRRSWETLAAQRNFSAILYGREWFEDLKRKMPDLEKLMGYGQKDYEDWLKAKNRQNNISNLMHFTEWKWKQANKK